MHFDQVTADCGGVVRRPRSRQSVPAILVIRLLLWFCNPSRVHARAWPSIVMSRSMSVPIGLADKHLVNMFEVANSKILLIPQ